MKTLPKIASAIMCLCGLTSVLQAQVPQLINYQGRVVVGTTNFDGSGQFKFALVNTAGTTTYWSNDGTSTNGSEPTNAVTLTVTKGLYSVGLGDNTLTNMTALPGSVFTNSDVRLRAWFNDGTHGSQLLTPDQRIATTGYAFMADNIKDGAITSTKLANGAVGTTQLASGAVGSANIASGAVGSTQLASGVTLAGTTTGTFSGPLSGNASTAGSATNFTGSLAGDVSGFQASTLVAFVGGVTATNVASGANLANAATNASTANAIVKRDASGNFSAGTITGSLNGNAMSATNVASGAVLTGLTISGTTQAAQANTNYVATSSSLTTVTLPGAANVGDVVEVSGVGAGGWAFGFNSGQQLITRWSPRDSNRNWQAIASSDDGSKLVAVVSSGQIYTSTDSGASWTPRDSSRLWRSVASSSDGSKLVAVANIGSIQPYTSTDSGVTWTPQDVPRGYQSVASSSDGTKLIASSAGQQLYISVNSGSSWSARDSSRNWAAVASSSDGSKLVAVVTGGQIYTSANSGVSFTPRDSNRSWTAVASSSDGSKLVALVNGGQIYTSTDSGVTWTPRDSSRSWAAVASSSDGSKLIALVNGGQIYTSTDSGVTWAPRESNRNWNAVASSADGTKLVAGVSIGQIYTTTTTLTGTQGSNATVVYLGSGLWTAEGASQIAPGEVDSTALASGLTLGGTTTGTFGGSGSALTSLNASNISSGTIDNSLTTGTNNNTASTLVLRDASGNFSAGTITGSLNGNAATATNATTATTAGSATNFTGSLGGDVTGTQSATAIAASTVTGKALTGFSSTTGTITASDTILSGIDKLYGNDALKAPLASPTFTGGISLSSGVVNIPASTSASNGVIQIGSVPFIAAPGTGNNFVGTGAGNFTLTGNYNTAIGDLAMNLASGAGSKNTGMGHGALFNNTGSNNTGLGYIALLNNTGNDNTAIGLSALQDNTSGGGNTAAGENALISNLTGSNNVSVGFNALFNTNGSGNTGIGTSALVQNTAGINNVAVGFNALTNATGSTNIGIGNNGGISVTSGSNNIDIGNNGAAESNTIRIGTSGTQTATFVAGISGATASGGVAVFVNANGQLGTLTSSRRFKTDIRPMGDASDVLLELKPVTFHYKPEIDPKAILQFGLIAEEVAQLCPELVVRDQKGEIQTVRYEQVSMMLLNEFLKQHQQIAELEKEREVKLAALRDENTRLRAENAANAKRLAALEARDKDRDARLTRLEIATPQARPVSNSVVESNTADEK